MQRLVLGLTALAILSGLSESAAADDWAECKRSNPEQRIAACSRIIDKGGEDRQSVALAHTNRGHANRAWGNNDKAIADFEEAIRLDPNRAAYNRGLIQATRGENDRAIADYTAALSLDPKDALAFNSRGNAHHVKREYALAIADHTSAIELDPKFAVAYSNRGNAHAAGKGDHALAISDYSKAIELAPDYAIAYNNRGLALEARGERDKAIADYDKAIALDAKYSSAYNNRGRARRQKGDHDLAIADYGKAIELNPKNVSAYNNRGVAYKAKGDIDRAIVEYSKAIELVPDYALAYNNRGLAFETKGERDKAIADYRSILELPAKTVTDKQRQEIARQRIARLTEAQRAIETTPTTAVAPPKPRVALVIGNSDYTSVGRLKNPKNDAEDVTKALRRLGFEVSEHYDLNRDKMGRALKDFGDRTEGAQWAVIFFAGHGLEMNGTTYLIPTDAELKRDTHVAHETVSLTQVQATVDPAAKLGLIFLDACRNNPFLRSMARSSAGARAVIGSGLANVEPEGSILVAYAAKHGTTASDGTGRNSPYTRALLAHIEEPGLEIGFLFRRIRDHVWKNTNPRQEPYTYGSLGGDPLYFKAATTGQVSAGQ